VIRAIFMITFLADRSIRPTGRRFYTMSVAFSAGGDGYSARSLHLPPYGLFRAGRLVRNP
jgi:hypothetical protein